MALEAAVPVCRLHLAQPVVHRVEHLELTGAVDAKAKTIEVRSVKRLGDVVQMSARPVKK